MNPITKILGQVLSLINGLLGSLNPKTVKAIQQAYYFLIFLLVLGGVVLGIVMGREAARIKSPPLASTVNEAFEYDISREKEDGSFTDTLESSTINEFRFSEPEKVKFPTQERLEPEHREGIIENRHEKMPDTGQFNALEGNYRPSSDDISDVRVLDKTETAEKSDDVRAPETPPLERENGKIREKEKSSVRIIRDREGTRSIEDKKSSPAPMEKSPDIIDQ